MSPRLDRQLALACAAIGLLLLLTTLAFVGADGGLNRQTAFLLLAGLALVIAYGVVDPGAIALLVRTRRGRLGTVSVLASAAVIGVLIGLNVLASRGAQAVDVTSAGQNTLSPRSVAVTRQLDADLVVTGFFRPDQLAARRDAQSLLDLYRQQSPRVMVRYADPDHDAGLALSLGAQVAGSIVLQYRTRPPLVLAPGQQSESDVTGAIQRLQSTRTPTVCWAAGDGERDLKDVDEVSGYSAVADLLRTSSYRAQDVLLGQQGVPATCDTLVVLQLGRPLGDPAVAAVQSYLARGGDLLIAVDPWIDPRTVASANAVLQPYGAAFDGGLVIEPEPAHSAVNDTTVPVVSSFGVSPITGNLDRRYVFFPVATPITGTAAAGATAVDLATTSDRAFAIAQERTDLSRRAADRPGPFALMRSIELARAGRTTRIVVAGTSALAENRTMPPATSSANSDLLLASLDWLTQQDTLVSISPRPARAQPLALSPAGAQWSALLATGLPVLLILAGGLAVRIRR